MKLKETWTNVADWVTRDDTPTVFTCVTVSAIASGFIAGGTFKISVAIAVFFGLTAIVRSL